MGLLISQTSLHHLSVSALLPQNSTWSQDRGRIWKLFRSHLDLVESPATEVGSHLDWSVSGSIGTLCMVTFGVLSVPRGEAFFFTLLHTLSIFMFLQQVCCTFRRFCRVLIWSEASGMQAICITLGSNLLKGNRCL